MSRPVLRRPDASPRGLARPPLTPSRLRRLGGAVLTGVATGAAVVVIAVLVRGRWTPLASLDQHAVAAGSTFAAAHPALLRALVDWQWVFLPTHVVGLGVVGALVFWWRTGQATRAWWAIATMLAAWGLSNVVKELARRARPVIEQPVETARGYSFPSGHAANTAAVTTTLVVMVWPLLRSRASKVAAVAGAVVLTSLTSLDRVLLGVHFPTDVTAGVLFGVGFVLASALAYKHWRAPADPGASS
ncbi:phosphatase PAP2 family protein [Cellulomonas alba]|uniref:Phosphatase PAP2 family protein n=1 Tax=Cellulomonas alba TaxID=3053467 RepID=A0ABT7SG84_9CELL|nr:phosphatase PAP2 family protein [Cellulomonas alba]MDM7854519.1 phosphatase PAP2 family protein [Cellulomonas alba]